MKKEVFEEIKAKAISLMEDTKDVQHDVSHLMRVEYNADVIIDVLDIRREIDVHLLKASVFLHDLSYSKYKPGFLMYLFESRRVKKMVKQLVREFDLDDEEMQIVVEAVATHTHSVPLRRLNKKRSVYAQVLQDADTLDFVTDVRLSTMKKASKGTPFYKILRIMSFITTNWLRRHIAFFLNYPETAQHFVLSKKKKN